MSMTFWKELTGNCLMLRTIAMFDSAVRAGDGRGHEDRVVSLNMTADGYIRITEECDAYFSVALTPTEAKAALLEAIAWIDSKCGKP